MASNPWAVVSQTPAQASPPTSDPWSVKAQTPDPGAGLSDNPNGEGQYQMRGPDGNAIPVTYSKIVDGLPQKMGFQFATPAEEARFNKDYGYTPQGARERAEGTAWNHAVGAVGDNAISREMAGDTGNFLENTSGAHPLSALFEGDTSFGGAVKDPNAGWGSKTAANIIELLAGEGEVRAIPTLAGRLQAIAPAMKVLEKFPKLRAAALLGMRAGTEIGAQDIAQGKGAKTSLEEGAEAGAIAPAASAVFTGIPSAIGRWVQKVRPTKVNIAGVDIPVLASQLNEAKMPIEGGAEGAPKMAAGQQEGAQQAIGNVAKNATQTALDRVNQTRPAIAATTDAARMLPAPEGAQPFTFTLGGTPTAEEPTGQIAHPAGKVQQPAAFPPKFTTASGPEPVAGGEGTTGADVSTATPPEARGETVGGGGVLQTTNPATAESWLRQLEEVEQSSAFKSLKPAQQEAISAERGRLADQLGMYHASPYAQHFGQVDTENALSHVRTFGDAADQIQAAVKPVYEKLDQVSNGDFNKYNQAAKQALRIMRSATSTDAYEAAEQRYREATGAIDDLINRHAGDVSTKDYSAAKMAWRDSSRLNELHSVFERMMNGITAEESDQGLSRVMTGRTKQLEAYLSKGQNREQIEGLIGTDGVTNLKKLTQLMSKANTNRQTVSAAREIYNRIAEHARVGGGGGLIGGAVAHWMGAPWYEGMLAGAATTEGIRAVMRDAMTNPRIGNLLDYAVEHGVSPAVYAPLIARAIVEPLEEPEPQQPEQTDQEENQQ
jgi:hypothetical protein